MKTGNLKVKKILFIIVLLLGGLFSSARFLNSGVRAEWLNFKGVPRGDFAGVFPVYWAWKVNPGLITQNVMTIDEMAKLATPDFSSAEFTKGRTAAELLRLVGQEKFNLTLPILRSSDIEKLNTIISLPGFIDSFSKRQDISSPEVRFFEKYTARHRQRALVYHELDAYKLKMIKIFNRLAIEDVYFEQTPKMVRLWHYGPFLHFLTFPLIFMASFQKAMQLWMLFSLLFLLVSLTIWHKILHPQAEPGPLVRFILLMALWFNFMPLYEGLSTGVAEILEFLMLTIFVFCYLRNKYVAGGIALGLAVMTKFLPAIFLPYLIVKKQYKMIAAAMVTLAVIAAAAEISLGWNGNAVFALLKAPWRSGWNWSYLQAFPDMVQRWFSSGFGYDSILHPTLLHPKLAKLISTFMVSSMVIFYTILFLKKRLSRRLDFEISIITILMISIIPHSHFYYLIFLLIPFSFAFDFILREYAPSGRGRRKALKDSWWLGISLVLAGVIFPVSILSAIAGRFRFDFLAAYYGFSLPCWGYLMLLGWFTVKYIKSPDFKKSSIQL